MNKTRNILICPLEWGLGHATRMISLASRLMKMNNNILFGAGEEHLALFRMEMPGARFINFPGFKPFYSRHIPQYLVLLLQTPLLMYHTIKEHIELKKIIRNNKVDIVISDNRFGLWNSKVKTVYVTHLPVIPLPRAFFFLEFIGILLHRAIIKKYDHCFIPDLPGKINVSGRLSHSVTLPGNTRFIGLLSRFTAIGNVESESPVKSRHNTVILSGPEPQRRILREKIIEIMKARDVPTVFLGGYPDKTPEVLRSDNIIFFNHLRASEMKAVITGSEAIITRSGYTTIMELISLGCSALIIPTPGQTEQEYLAEYLQENGWFKSVSQQELNSGLTLPKLKPGWTEEIMAQSGDLLEKALEVLSED